MPTGDFEGFVLGTNLSGTDNADGTITIDATGGSSGTELAYTQFTSSVTINNGTEAGANTIVTASAITADGSTPIYVEFFAPLVRNTNISAVTVYLFEDGTSLGPWAAADITAANSGYPIYCGLRRVPAAGSRTYSVRANRGAGTGTVYGGAGGTGVTQPGFIRICEVA